MACLQQLSGYLIPVKVIIDSIMDQIQAGDQVVRFDTELTRQAYASLKDGDAERCGCVYCRNFAAQRETVYPEIFRRLLDQIGIDFKKEGEVYECGADVLLRVYGGWFYFAGNLVEQVERLTDGGSGFQYHFVDAKHLPKAPADFGDNLAAVEFYTKAPWVLPEQPT